MKFILSLIVLGLLGYGVYAFMQNDTDAPPPVVQGPNVIPDDDPESGDPVTGGAENQPATVSSDPIGRVDAERSEVDIASGAELPQGVFGRAIDPSGRPVEGVEVYLRLVPPGGIFGPVLMKQRGLTNAPLAKSVTDENGEFRLGLRRVQPGQHEMLFVTNQLQDRHIPAVDVWEGGWNELGDVKLQRGCIVSGRVQDAQTGAPIAGATITARSPLAGTFTAAPGREQGVPATTDENGNYRFDSLAPGSVQLTAVAKGYAQMTDIDTRPALGTPARKDFALSPGKEIAGFVTDSEGNGIPHAEVDAVCLSAKTPMRVITKADKTGYFEVLGLVDAPFQLQARAAGYIGAPLQPVEAGETDAQIVLEKQGGARVRVVGKNGRAIKSYNLRVLRHFQQNDTYGAVHEIPVRDIRSRDLDKDGSFEVTGLNPGRYAFEITVKGYAKTRSDAVQVASNAPSELVTVSMKSGGVISGTVLGPDGSPLAGVEVKTQPPNFVEMPFLSDLAGLMVTDITKSVTKTGSDGRFKLSSLAAGTYQLRFSHPDAFVKHLREVVVADEQTTETETMRLERGTQVFGTITVDGQPGVGVKVTISTAMAPNAAPGANALNRFSEQALTNERGEFVLSRRVPPGRYTLRAGRTTGGNPMMVMLDFKKTEQEIEFRNQDSFEYSPNIVSN